MEINERLREVIIYTDPRHGERVATECLRHYGVPFTYIRDHNSNVVGILFDVWVLDLLTHDVSMVQ